MLLRALMRRLHSLWATEDDTPTVGEPITDPPEPKPVGKPLPAGPAAEPVGTPVTDPSHTPWTRPRRAEPPHPSKPGEDLGSSYEKDKERKGNPDNPIEDGSWPSLDDVVEEFFNDMDDELPAVRTTSSPAQSSLEG